MAASPVKLVYRWYSASAGARAAAASSPVLHREPRAKNRDRGKVNALFIAADKNICAGRSAPLPASYSAETGFSFFQEQEGLSPIEIAAVLLPCCFCFATRAFSQKTVGYSKEVINLWLRLCDLVAQSVWL